MTDNAAALAAALTRKIDGRENDETITVEVSWLWSLLDLAALPAHPPAPPEDEPGYYCDECPHAMFLHEDDGSCGGGCH